jgi:hypothetical protein
LVELELEDTFYDLSLLLNCFQDMQDMREGYDRLLEVAAAMANSAYGK